MGGMHTTKSLRSGNFGFEVEGEVTGFSAVLPRFDEMDRLGVVVDQDCGAIGASNLILAAVTAFYDRQRARFSDFFVYPDFYVFHVGRRHGDHGMLDIFPAPKEVVVDNDPTSILQAINDRRITRLLVPDGVYHEPGLNRITLGSVHVTDALAYSPDGRVDSPDIWAAGNDASQRYVGDVIDASVDFIGAGAQASRHQSRTALERDEIPVESYRRVTVDQALGMLAR